MTDFRLVRSDCRQATAIDLGLCDGCAALHINFIDKAGAVFATASLPAEHWAAFRRQFDELARESVSRPAVAPRRNQ